MDGKSRRDFIAKMSILLGAGCAVATGGGFLLAHRHAWAQSPNVDACFDGQCGRRFFGAALPHDRVARYWEPLRDGRVHCSLCPYNCVLEDGGRCRCQAKENSGGTLYDMVYGYVATMHLDSIEKLPLYHRYPGLSTLALGTAGCGLHCQYCQNWQLSQLPPEDTENFQLTPTEIVEVAKRHGAEAIALAYTEPLTFFEFSCDIAAAARQAGLKVFMGTGGFACPDPVRELAELVDGVAFGLKGFNDSFYGEVIGPSVKLDHILASLEAFKAAGTHIEVANLIVPTKNDQPEDIKPLARYVKTTLGENTPLHFLKFFPHFQLKQLPPTSQRTMEQAAEMARLEGLRYVYIGNLPGHSGNNTYCPDCGALAIQRIGFRVLAANVDSSGCCNECGERIAGELHPYKLAG